MPIRRPPPSARPAHPARPQPAAAPQPINDLVKWERVLDRTGREPAELYRIEYCDRTGEVTVRELELRKVGTLDGTPYLGVLHDGRFKTLRADRVLSVVQLSAGHAPSIHAEPTYATELPPFPAPVICRIPTVAAGNRTWTVDLACYTCTCPERRVRTARGYRAGQLGFVCPHVARAILEHLPADAPAWPPELRRFLADPRKVHIDNLT